jgi:tetratricopeptide (TPR) repeat protein
MPATPRRFALAAATAAAALSFGLPALGQAVDSGAYLAARVASAQSDYAAAARYYSQALTRDSDNPVLLDSTVTAYVGLGQIDSAEALAQRLLEAEAPSQVALLVRAVAQAAAGRCWAQARPRRRWRNSTLWRRPRA